MDGHPEMSIWRHRLGWLTGLSLLVVLLLPQTGWLARTQIQRVFVSASWAVPVAKELGTATGDYDAPASDFGVRIDAVVREHPDDLGMALASTYFEPQQLKLFIPRFSNRPSIYANLLRSLCQRGLYLHERGHGGLFVGGPTQGSLQDVTFEPHEPAPTAVQLSEYDSYAEMGESLDPDNAYFPMMRAIGQNVAGHSEIAWESLKRASTKTRWESYIGDEAAGWGRLMQKASGDNSQLVDLSASMIVRFPHNGALSTNQRFFVKQAFNLELAGKFQEARAIYETLIRCGRLMRTAASTLPESRSGALLERRALDLEDEASRRESSKSSAAVRDELQTARLEQLRQHGEGAFARWAAGEMKDVDVTIRRMEIADQQKEDYEPLIRLIEFWLAGLLLLSWAVWAVVLGVAASLFSRVREIQVVKRLPNSLRAAVIYGALMAVTLVFIVGYTAHAPWDYSGNPAYPAISKSFKWLVGPFIVTSILFLMRPPDSEWGVVRRFVGTTLLTMAVMMSAAMAVLTFSRGAQVLALFGDSGDGMCMNWVEPPHLSEMKMYHDMWPIFFTSLPLLCLFILAFASIVNKIPLGSGIVHGLKRLAVPISCTLALAWLITIPFILRQERIASDSLALNVKNNVSFLTIKSGYGDLLSKRQPHLSQVEGGCH